MTQFANTSVPATAAPAKDLNVATNPETDRLVEAVKDALDSAGVNGYERDLAAFSTRIDPFVSEALKSNNKLSRGLFNQRLHLMINRPSFGMLNRHRDTVIAAANTHMGTKLPAAEKK